MWSLRPTPDEIFAAIRAGATGYLRKETSAKELVRSLRDAALGKRPLAGDLIALMIDAIHDAENGSRVRELAAVLSSREREVLDHLARGARNREIADELAISEFTVKRHVQNILQKLQLPSRRAAAVFYASFAQTLAAADTERP